MPAGGSASRRASPPPAGRSHSADRSSRSSLFFASGSGRAEVKRREPSGRKAPLLSPLAERVRRRGGASPAGSSCQRAVWNLVPSGATVETDVTRRDPSGERASPETRGRARKESRSKVTARTVVEAPRRTGRDSWNGKPRKPRKSVPRTHRPSSEADSHGRERALQGRRRGVVDALQGSTSGGGQDEGEAAGRLLVPPHQGDEVGGGDAVGGGGGEAEAAEHRPGGVGGVGRETVEGGGEFGGEDEADGDRFTMEEAVVAEGLEGVGQGVAVVERGPQAGPLVLVGRDDRRLDGGRTGDDVGENSGVAGQEGGGGRLVGQRGREFGVTHEGVLRHLAEPGAVLAVGKRGEGVDVAQHG